MLLRFMQTFMIYTEPFVVTGGGPGSATTFLSIDLVKIALGQVDLGNAAAMSLGYYLITLTVCWIFFTIMTQTRAAEGRLMQQGALPKIFLAIYLVLLMLPIYWLINMSPRTNSDIMSGLALWPHHPTIEKYIQIFKDPTWVHGFGVSLTYVAINTIISVTVALSAAYAFNRYAFIGDKHLFFWLLTNLMAPTAVFAMPFFNLYYAVGLFDTVWAVALAHCLFNIPLAV